MKIPYKLMAAGALASALLLTPTAKAEATGSCKIPAWKHTVPTIASESILHIETAKRYADTSWELNESLSHSGARTNVLNDSVSVPQIRYLGQFKITGYDTCAACCGKTDGITASGTMATVGRTCAASADLPFGTRLWIEGIGERIVEDRGGAIKGNRIDVLCANHPDSYAITGTYNVYIIGED